MIKEMTKTQKELLTMKREVVHQAKALFDMKQQEFYAAIRMVAEELGIPDLTKYNIDIDKGIFEEQKIPQPILTIPKRNKVK